MTVEKHRVPVDGTWHACPSCDYDGGWHVFLRRANGPRLVNMYLQCPSCKTEVDLGLQVQVKQ